VVFAVARKLEEVEFERTGRVDDEVLASAGSEPLDVV